MFKRFFLYFVKAEAGVTAADCALVIGSVALAVLIGANTIGSEVVNTLERAAPVLNPAAYKDTGGTGTGKDTDTDTGPVADAGKGMAKGKAKLRSKGQ
jgi:Flp pilus assembly pilin Flp